MRESTRERLPVDADTGELPRNPLENRVHLSTLRAKSWAEKGVKYKGTSLAPAEYDHASARKKGNAKAEETASDGDPGDEGEDRPPRKQRSKVAEKDFVVPDDEPQLNPDAGYKPSGSSSRSKPKVTKSKPLITNSDEEDPSERFTAPPKPPAKNKLKPKAKAPKGEKGKLKKAADEDDTLETVPINLDDDGDTHMDAVPARDDDGGDEDEAPGNDDEDERQGDEGDEVEHGTTTPDRRPRPSSSDMEESDGDGTPTQKKAGKADVGDLDALALQGKKLRLDETDYGDDDAAVTAKPKTSGGTGKKTRSKKTAEPAKGKSRGKGSKGKLETTQTVPNPRKRSKDPSGEESELTEEDEGPSNKRTKS